MFTGGNKVISVNEIHTKRHLTTAKLFNDENMEKIESYNAVCNKGWARWKNTTQIKRLLTPRWPE